MSPLRLDPKYIEYYMDVGSTLCSSLCSWYHALVFNFSGELQLSSPVPQWSLQSDAHQEVNLARHQDVLQGIEEVGNHHNIEF